MFPISFITWPFQPEIFTFFGITLRWYGLLFAGAFVFGYYLTRKDLLKIGISENSIDYLLLFILPGAVIGARLGHVFFYEPQYYLANPTEILKTWNGGLASHGGAIGILIALWFYARKIKEPWLWVIDRVVAVVAFGGMFIRIGNLMNSEIIGKATNLPWAFIFPNVDSIPRHPAQLYEAIGYLLIFFFLRHLHYKYENKAPNGLLLSWFLVLVFGIRFLIEFIKEPQELFEQSMFLNMGQWLSLPFVVFGSIFLVYLYRNFKPNRYV